MSVIFESAIKIDENQNWFIELKDLVSHKVEICKDLDEYSEKVEEFGANYGGQIDEVIWRKDESVPPHIMDEIRLEMAKHQAEIESKNE
jgi:hypothetical protein